MKRSKFFVHPIQSVCAGSHRQNLYSISTSDIHPRCAWSPYLHPFRILITKLSVIYVRCSVVVLFQYLFAKISDVSISVSLRKDLRCQYFSISSQRSQMSVFQYLFAKISDVSISVSLYGSPLLHCQGVYLFRDGYCCMLFAIISL